MSNASKLSLGLARRQLLASGGLLALLVAAPRLARAAPGAVIIEKFSPSGQDLGPATVAKIDRSEADWRRLLSPQSFEITRHADTAAQICPSLASKKLSPHVLRHYVDGWVMWPAAVFPLLGLSLRSVSAT